MLSISVMLKSAADHAGECFCLCASSSADGVTSSSGQSSPPSTVPLGQYSITVQQSVAVQACTFHSLMNDVDHFSVLTLLVGYQTEHPVCKNLVPSGTPAYSGVISGKIGWLNKSQK